jgi:diacylglycerol kinase (CTP)
MSKPESLVLSKRSDLHLARKLWHIVMGLFILFVYIGFQLSQGVAVALLGTFLVFALVLERARLRNTQFNNKLYAVFKKIMREHEFSNVSGIPYYLAGVIIAIGIFPKPVAIISILYLICGDPIASVFGILYGDKGARWKNGKSLIGTLAGVIACFLTGFFLLLGIYPISFSLFFIALLGGIFGGLVEHLPFDIDDNFTIPVISGFFVWALFLYFDLSLLI